MAPKMGLVALASKFELGGERSEELTEAVAKAVRSAGVELVVIENVVGSVGEALDACDQLKGSGITSLLVLDVTWQGDAIKYILTQELNLPTVYWTFPYPDTYAIACVQHYGSILKTQGIPYQYVYGLPTDEPSVNKVVQVARAGQIIETLKDTRIALVGPRNAWRIAGPQEMVNEEWEISRFFGITIIHLEMNEITDFASEVSDEQAEKTLDELAARIGTVNADRPTMRQAAKVYLAIKELFRKYRLNAVAAECYPMFAGLVNAAASWLGDEGLIVETEGDIGGSIAHLILNTAAADDAVAVSSVLGEIGSYDDEAFVFAHEGSTATEYATDVSNVVIQQMGEDGTQVCLVVKPMEKATVCSLVGGAGKYKMLVAEASTLEASQEEWNAAGGRLYAKLRFNNATPGDAMATMIREGIDHHWVIKEGDYSQLVQILCDYLKVDTLYI